MRQGQHHNNNNNNNNNKRMRGRNRGKGPNPLTRSYESNGGDVKIRGIALHVAEKYVQLARDAQASGDRVAQENYLQHAEHYYRIVAAAQAQMPQPQPIYRNDEDGDDEEGTDRPDNRNVYGGGGQQRPPNQQGGPPYQQPYQQSYEQQSYPSGGNNGSFNGNGQDVPQSDEGPVDPGAEQTGEFRGEQRNDNYDNRGGDRNQGGGNQRHRRRRPYRDNYGDRGGEQQRSSGGSPEPVDTASEPRGEE